MHKVQTISSLALVVGLLAIACGDNTPERPDGSTGHDARMMDDGGSQPDAGGLHFPLTPPPDGQGVQLNYQFPLDAGEQVHTCQYFVLPAGQELDVSKVESAFNSGVHHFLVYLTPMTKAEVPTLDPFDCSPGGLYEHLGVADGFRTSYYSEKPSFSLAFPPGIALKFPSEAVVAFEVHHLNASTQPVMAQIDVNLWYSTETVTGEVGDFQLYDILIYVPPRGTFSTTVQCHMPANITLLTGIAHTHFRGSAYRSFAVKNPGPMETRMPLVMADSYAAMGEPVIYPNGGVPLAQGDILEFSCDWQNMDDRPYAQGPNAYDNEMCMYIGLYYPRQDLATDRCWNPGDGPLLNGTKNGADAMSCFMAATDFADKQKCVVDTCPGASTAMNNFFNCAGVNCVQVCSLEINDACNMCITQHCVNEFFMAQQATCN